MATMSPISSLSNMDLVGSPMSDLQDITGTFSSSELDPAGAMTVQLSSTKQLPLNGSSQKTRKASRIYNCKECKYATSNLKKLGNHMRDEHKRHGFKCDFCATHVTRYDNLKSHQRSCKGIAKRLPTPSLASSMKGEKRQRISVLNLQNVAPASCPTPTRGVSPTRNENPINVEISSGSKTADIQPPRNGQINVSTTLGDGICNDLSIPNDFLNIDIIQLTVQLEAYKKELRRIKEYLAQMREERDVWRRQYFQSKQPDGYKNEDDIIGSPLAA
ncbi:hypothetical protein H072_6244 [Dactylellina haptotyla CBS 200.50]|uniref:C2H2-type domain-containing protein n=1 Tax=Dactylellina haptotyla (strain CBS 200.50) TaxID=1284197 RepID=S8BXE1_DACHA|nr:hypothetical protein H072_6244 [Dactylellina haptotyla CBS 200.50]